MATAGKKTAADGEAKKPRAAAKKKVGTEALQHDASAEAEAPAPSEGAPSGRAARKKAPATKKTLAPQSEAAAESAAEPAPKKKAASKKKTTAVQAAAPAPAVPEPAEGAAEGRGTQPEPGTGATPPPFPDTEYAVVEKLLTGFLAAEVRKVGVARAVLGLSGGVDSAVSAALAVRALGAGAVLGVFMPYRSSSPESESDARAVAASLGIEMLVVDITPQVDAYFDRFAEASKLRRGNKMARERMTILYDHSAARSALVIGTSNKTELLLGYGTLYGDMASALNPIGDLYKTQVWGLARHLGLPASVIDKAPTADLWSGQTDETELGFSYHDVDRLLYRLIDERCSVDELVALGFDAAFVERISRMVRSSQFKRRLPVIAKLSARSIDTDFRYSRDWGL